MTRTNKIRRNADCSQMNSSTNQHQYTFLRRKVHDRSCKRKYSIAIICLSVLTPTPVLSFTNFYTSSRKRTLSTRHHFRIEGEDFSRVSEEVLPSRRNTFSIFQYMPVWLRHQTGENADQILADLHAVAKERYLSEMEAGQIVTAITLAADGDNKKIAGAAQLCQILLETMDMGVDTVIAAAYHYCSCFEARKRNIIANQASSQPFSTLIYSMWDVNDHHNFDSRHLNPEVAKIIRDTAALKRTEMVASSLVKSTDFDTLRVFLLSETNDWRALAIRSAASLYRLRGIINAQSNSTEYTFSQDEMRVAREALNIFAPLAYRLGMHRLKNELEGTAFRILYKRQYKTVMDLIQQTEHYKEELDSLTLSEKMNSVVAEVSERIKEELEKNPTLTSHAKKIVVSARVKQPFSLWKKMLSKGVKNILDVHDALALRIVIEGEKLTPDEDDKITRARERVLCYYVRNLCTQKWVPNAERPRFKDYIERPKSNGYQSLHYMANTKWQDEDWNFEIQIRSGEMHSVAEYGLAAHWDYKLGDDYEKGRKKSYQLDHTSEAYLKSVQAWHWQQVGNPYSNISPLKNMEDTKYASVINGMNKVRAERERANAERLAPYIEQFSTARSSITRNQVFVFFSPTEGSEIFDGKIISLPSGSRVMDALREGEKLYGITTNFYGSGVIQNDKETILTERLNNGDVLKVPAINIGSKF